MMNERLPTVPPKGRSHRPPILKPDESYTFRSYFLMKFAPADILRELGATLIRAAIALPVASSVQLPQLPDLRQRLEDGIARVSLTNKAARWEVLIAPILHGYNQKEKALFVRNG